MVHFRRVLRAALCFPRAFLPKILASTALIPDINPPAKKVAQLLSRELFLRRRRWIYLNDSGGQPTIASCGLAVTDVQDVLEWLKWPNGTRTVHVRAPFADVFSTGYVWSDVSHKGSVRSGYFTRKKACCGVLQCSQQCGYIQRPFLRPERTEKEPPSKRYRTKVYREFCRGLCIEGGNAEVPLERVYCSCTLVYRSSGDGALTVVHEGTHNHPRPQVVRITGKEYRKIVEKIKEGERISPKKTPAMQNLTRQVTPLRLSAGE